MTESNLILHIKAPLGVSRQLSTESHRGTYPVLSHTTLYGLLCNLAGVEMRVYDPNFKNMAIRTDLPKIGIRVGYVSLPMHSRLFEHTLKKMKNGDKKSEIGDVGKACRQFIKPKRTDYLTKLDLYVEVSARSELIDRIRRYITGVNVDTILGTDKVRYGLPFIGTNNCTVQSIDIVDTFPDGELYWLNHMTKTTQKTHEFAVSMPVWIDRQHVNNTKVGYFSVMRGVDLGDMVSIGPVG